MASPPTTQRFAFVFPMASGHINPSLAVARSLVGLGHEVHYLCREQMREAIEDTGASFHSEIKQLPELYGGREPDLHGALESLKKEHGFPELGKFLLSGCKLVHVQAQMMMPGMLRFLREVRPDALVFCPMMNREAALAAEVLGIPRVSILTTAGPGSLTEAMGEFMAQEGVTIDDLEQEMLGFEPHLKATREMNAEYGMDLPTALSWTRPLGFMDTMERAHLNLVTTSAELQDPVTPELEEKYKATSFAFVGPLLDKAGAKRASVHKFDAQPHAEGVGAEHEHKAADLLKQVSAAKVAGRPLVLVSMGTVVTGDHPQVGWGGRLPGKDGEPTGLTGRELCQAAWGGVFDTFGAGSADEGALIVLALGPQVEPLGDLRAPPNAICAPSIPQVDLLRAGVSVFLTHGGQNSFTEAIANGAPVVVCPGFGDQIVNSRKAVALAMGCKVDRPDPARGEEAQAAADFRAAVGQALSQVFSEPAYAAAAARLREGLESAGGVPRAVELVLAAAAEPADGTAEQAGATAPRKFVPLAPTAGVGAAQRAGA